MGKPKLQIYWESPLLYLKSILKIDIWNINLSAVNQPPPPQKKNWIKNTSRKVTENKSIYMIGWSKSLLTRDLHIKTQSDSTVHLSD